MAPVALPRNVSRAKIDAEHCLAEVFDGALSAAECAAVVGRYGNVGDLKKVRDAARPDGTRMAIANPRNYSLGVFEDAALEGALWRRISASAGGAALEKFRAFRDEAPPRGLNGRLRILRYGAGERFEPHYDLVVADDDGGRRSLATVLVYLTADFSGGGTRFLDRDGGGCRAGARRACMQWRGGGRSRKGSWERQWEAKERQWKDSGRPRKGSDTAVGGQRKAVGKGQGTAGTHGLG